MSIVTVVCLPLTVGELAYRVWIYGQLLCKLAGYLQGAHNLHGIPLNQYHILSIFSITVENDILRSVYALPITIIITELVKQNWQYEQIAD